MIDTESLRKKIIELALQGKLTEQLPSDGDAETLYAQILDHKSQLIKEGKIKKDKELQNIAADEIPFEIPGNWKWVHMGDIFDHNTGKALNNADKEGTKLEYITTSNMYWDHFELDGLKSMFFKESEIEKCTIRKGDLLICEGGDIGRSAIWSFDYEMRIQNHIHKLRGYGGIDHRFYFYMMRNYKDSGMIDGRGIGLQGFSSKRVHSLVVPLAPLAEQKRIADKLEEVLAQIDIIDDLQAKYSNDLAVLKSKIIDAGIQGKLTEQLPEDGNAEDLYAQILNQKSQLIKEGKIKKEKPLPDIAADEIPFEIPKNWKWVRFGSMTFIERGGSPRPIKSYITDSEDGINWIKIGDVEKGGKYIYSTKEKIIPEGEKKSRHVYPGDFLLTNSMSFGRPYISKVEGCIHDGWLLIRDLNGFNADYLYYLLSSKYMYAQFCNKASGATVDNLNIDKVNSALIPLPPLKEQERIASKVEAILEQL